MFLNVDSSHLFAKVFMSPLTSSRWCLSLADVLSEYLAPYLLLLCCITLCGKLLSEVKLIRYEMCA